MASSRRRIGLDFWRLQSATRPFLKLVRQCDLELYDIAIHQNDITFYAPISKRMDIHRYVEGAQLLRTTGMLGYLLRNLRRPIRLISLLCVALLWYGLSHIVFEVEIKGEQKESRALIEQTLQTMGYQVPFYSSDVNDIKMKLKKTLENEIAWLEIEKMGSRYRISYTPKEFASLQTLSNDELIAQRDGLIQRFDIEHGNKVKKVNDFVHAGDVLVSNVITNTANENKETYVKGRVFAYTWSDIRVEMDANDLPRSFQYYDLLMEARREVSKDFKENDAIDKENILQFSSDMGKIEMMVHYTLIRDITTP